MRPRRTAGAVLVGVAVALAAPLPAPSALAGPAAAAPGSGGPGSGGPRSAGTEPTAVPGQSAQPAAAPTGPALASAAAGCTPAPGRGEPPVRITVVRLEPRTIRPGGQVGVLAVLQNCGSVPLTQARVRLRSGGILVTRTELANADNQPLTERAAAAWLDIAPLGAGASLQVQYQTTVADLRLTAIGVYPAEFEVQAAPAVDAARERVGAVRTYLPYFPEGVARPTGVTWLLPFADRPHRHYEPTGDATATAESRVLIDDQLTGLLHGNGRLNRLLTIGERADAGGVPFAIAVDPDLIDTVHEMTLGYRVQVNRTTVEGTGTQAATLWLSRLSALAGRHQVIALPYADADLVALTGNGPTTELARTRPETLAVLGEQLHASLDSQVAWPAGGLLSDRALDAVVTQGATAVVLDAASLSNPAGVPPSGRTQSAVSPLPSVSGNARALVADRGVTLLASGAVPVPGGARLAEQRYLAELGMITAEAPSIRRQILVAPPHDWFPSPATALAMMRDTRDVPWLSAFSVAELLRSTPVDRGSLVYPRGSPQLAAGQIGRIRKLMELVEQFRSALDNRAESRLLERFTTALQRAASSFWRTTPGAAPNTRAGMAAHAGLVFLAPIGNLIKTIVRDRVYIVRPQDGKYSLGSRNSQLPLTVVNNLEVAVRVRVRISAQGTVGFQAEERDATLDAGKRTLVRIPATVTQSGRFQVQAVLLTPDGKQLTNPIALTVQSTAYGAVALGITGAAFALLVLLLARRIVQRIRSGPDDAALQPAGSPTERGT